MGHESVVLLRKYFQSVCSTDTESMLYHKERLSQLFFTENKGYVVYQY